MCNCQKETSCCSKCGCGCQQNSGSCGCSPKGCGCGSKANEENCSAKYLELADQAWMEVLKEKIKEHIKANSKHIDELAQIVAEANQERWKKKMDAKSCCCSFEEKIKNFFQQSCKK